MHCICCIEYICENRTTNQLYIKHYRFQIISTPCFWFTCDDSFCLPETAFQNSNFRTHKQLSWKFYDTFYYSLAIVYRVNFVLRCRFLPLLYTYSFAQVIPTTHIYSNIIQFIMIAMQSSCVLCKMYYTRTNSRSNKFKLYEKSRYGEEKMDG